MLLLVARLNRLARDYPQTSSLRFGAHKLFDDPILQRVKSNDRHPSPRCKQFDDLRQRRFQARQFIVDGNPQRLKGAGCGMDPAALSSKRPADDQRQFVGGCHRFALPGCDNRSRDAA